jgi:glycosyltransferase
MITIITAVKNGARTIADCVQSVKMQSVQPEHIIMDGDSSDNTLAIIERHKYESLNLYSAPDRGIYDAMNRGINLANGEIIGLLNADDVFFDRNVLKRVITAFRESTTAACYGDLIYVARDNLNKIDRYWKSCRFSSKKMYWGWMPPHPTFFVRRSVYEKFGLFNLTLGSAADYELMLRFLLKNRISVKYIDHILVKMRTGGQSNASIRNRVSANLMDHRAWRINGLSPYPWTLLAKPLRKLPQFWKKPPMIASVSE